jgi:hypothetical protein
MIRKSGSRYSEKTMLHKTDVAREFLPAMLALPEVKKLLLSEHFSVDGTLIEAWASMKSFRPKDGSGDRTGASVASDGI